MSTILDTHRMLDLVPPNPGCVMNLTSGYATAVLADSPVGYWQAQECFGNLADSGSGAATMFRRSGLQTYRSSTPLTPTDTYSVEMAGGSLYQASPVPTAATDNVSMELWVKLVTPYATLNNNEVFYNGRSSANGYGILCDTTDAFKLLCGGVGFGGGTPPVSRDVWHHIVMVRVAGTWKFYLDGVISNPAASVLNPNVPDTNIFLGGNAVQRQNCHFAIYATALSAAQVAAHYAAR